MVAIETQCVPFDAAQVASQFDVDGVDEVITITLEGAGRNNIVGTLAARPGLRAIELLVRVAQMLTQDTEEIRLVNLDNPMYLVGDMRLTRNTRVGVQINLRGG